jgi:uncharacterized protein YndB with AHSA1/START domain
MNIEITKEIHAPPERVFRALTNADELARWWVSSAETDPRTGGDYVLRFEFEDAARNHTFSGRYEQVDDNERVRYPWNGEFGETTVEFALRPGDGGTELRLLHFGWSDEANEDRQMYDQGWRFFLDNLERYLTGGDDQRAASGMKTSLSAGASTGAGP